MDLLVFITFLILLFLLRHYLLKQLRSTIPHFSQQSVPDADPIFPLGFNFGVSTAAYQIEENCPPSNWKLWEKQYDENGRQRAPTADEKCQGYSRFIQDIELIQHLDCNFYRFSLLWSRINPRPGYFDDSVMNIYRANIIKLKESGIEPLLVLWHFEHPAWLEERGSVMSDEFVSRFGEYVEYVLRNIGSLVNLYNTVNEPFGFVATALFSGLHPPGKKSLKEMFQAMYNLMQCHANAYHLIRKYNPNAKVSYAKNIVPFVPVHKWSLIEHIIAYYLNSYSRIGFSIFETGKLRFLWMEKEFDNIIGTLDYISLNHYYVAFVSINPKEWSKLNGNTVPFLTYGERFLPTNDMGWGMLPSSLAGITKWLHEKFNKQKNLPVMITEHGAADKEDTKRQWFTKESLLHLSMLAEEVPLMGYTHWTLMDNYEWAEGLDMRFGLYEMDYNTQERKPRQSVEMFRKIIEVNRNQPDF
ncbi:glycoside hydrolase family 1 protein [Histomonas meleagridis]|uniref:glycoside hydrolase family 1 protein n=1 Tax=Histomonas meleagridis TaxID=135588 RepID=UPI00355A679C|nr:glycoside hydrolase family 1 protein [Histomonas meleagridis]KAH0800754.1 glycoside hydrolase family 1 protein [Histomonas meleagridis]